MVANFHPPKALPADPLGQRLHEIFGRNPWDFLEAAAPKPGEKPKWRTVKKYKIGPRIFWQRWQDPDTLIGVRFESETYYALIDVDFWSRYCTAEAIAQLRAGLETIGITRTLLLRSSHSNGLHLYIPLPEPVKTFDLAVALEACLKAQDFQLANGTLEIFPNPKPYGVKQIIHYNGHRLPLQPGTGSYLLDDDLNPISDQLDRFFWQWDGAASHQDMDALRHALKVGRDNRRKKPRRSLYPSNSTLAIWRQDLESELEAGWSGHGQTNHLLKTVACYGRVFLELSGDELMTHTLETVLQLPGYRQHCRHQHEIELKVQAWRKSVENYYWPLSDNPKRDTRVNRPPQPSVNQQRAENARERIEQAIATLQQLGELPSKIRDLTQQLAEIARCSLRTIYKHTALWHPAQTQKPEERPVTAPVEAVSPLAKAVEVCPAIPPPPPPDPPDPLPAGLLPTQERSMKCKTAPSPKKNPLERGVRGERTNRFPQPVKLAGDMSRDEHYRSLPPPSSSASLEEQERHRNQEALRRCLFQLKWGHPQLTQYIAEQFEGRRFYQLTPEEVTLLVYRLQVRLMNGPPELL